MSVRPEATVRHMIAASKEGARAAEERSQRLLARLPRVREIVVDRFGATQVWLFGSLAVGQVDVDSDVDLAVAGLSPREHMSALGELMALFGGPVDLVRIEEAPESLRRRIADEGRELVASVSG